MSSRKFVIANPDRCIGCDTCMASCLSGHYKLGDPLAPRLHVIRTLDISAPIVCHHCEDAACVSACPTHAMHYVDDTVQCEHSICVGCANCVIACPFGAIQMLAESNKMRIGDLTLQSQFKKITILKCDLCADRGYKARCMEACPTHGLRLMDEDEIERLRKEREIKAVNQLKNLVSASM